MSQSEYEQLRADPSLWLPAGPQACGPDKAQASIRPQSYARMLAGRFFQNRMALVGIVILVVMSVMAVIGPVISGKSFEKTNLDFTNLPPLLAVYQVDEDHYVYLHPDYYLIEVSAQGDILQRLPEVRNDLANRVRTYSLAGHELVVDYSYYAKAQAEGTAAEQLVTLSCDGAERPVWRTVWNRTYPWGSDLLGRDIFVRTMWGARISLSIALAATLLNGVIGVVLGSLAGYMGGTADNLIMRFVDVISTIPMTLIVMMLMVVLGSSIGTLMLALGISSWVSLARIVRSQVLSLRERDFIWAARSMNAGHWWMLRRHLIPNLLPSIITCMSMMLPSIIFTESFLSFIGLGVTAPNASWGTMVSDGLSGLKVFPYQLIIPAAAVCLATLSFNFIGKAMENATAPYGERR